MSASKEISEKITHRVDEWIKHLNLSGIKPVKLAAKNAIYGKLATTLKQANEGATYEEVRDLLCENMKKLDGRNHHPAFDNFTENMEFFASHIGNDYFDNLPENYQYLSEEGIILEAVRDKLSSMVNDHLEKAKDNINLLN